MARCGAARSSMVRRRLPLPPATDPSLHRELALSTTQAAWLAAEPSDGAWEGSLQRTPQGKMVPRPGILTSKGSKAANRYSLRMLLDELDPERISRDLQNQPKALSLLPHAWSIQESARSVQQSTCPLLTFRHYEWQSLPSSQLFSDQSRLRSRYFSSKPYTLL